MTQIHLARRRLGRSDLLVSELCLGTLNFGWHTGEPVAFEIMDAFHAAGGNFIQACGLSSDEDFGPGSTGVSETYAGRWLRARGISRDEVVIASRHSPGLDTKRRDVFATASEIRRMCEESLRRLQVRYLDLLVLEWSENMTMDETLLGAETLFPSAQCLSRVCSVCGKWIRSGSRPRRPAGATRIR
ncbi:MAG: aldo/keto reductase [Opitutaceae bacterium]